MNKKISTISWIWDSYGAKFTEIRKAINRLAPSNEIPTKKCIQHLILHWNMK